MKVGLDIHGVIDSNPELFSKLTALLSNGGHEVHIITGEELSDKLIDELKDYNITYHKIFSITSHHKKIGTHIVYRCPNHPLINPNKWDKTKAEYCAEIGIRLHIDDSDVYGKYFPSDITYIRYSKQVEELLMVLINT